MFMFKKCRIHCSIFLITHRARSLQIKEKASKLSYITLLYTLWEYILTKVQTSTLTQYVVVTLSISVHLQGRFKYHPPNSNTAKHGLVSESVCKIRIEIAQYS